MNHTKLIQDSTKAYMNVFKTEVEQEQQAQSLLGIMLSMVEQVQQDRDDSEKELHLLHLKFSWCNKWCNV